MRNCVHQIWRVNGLKNKFVESVIFDVGEDRDTNSVVNMEGIELGEPKVCLLRSLFILCYCYMRSSPSLIFLERVVYSHHLRDRC